MSEPYSATEHTKRRVKSPIPESADVIVIGCGLGGLMAAAGLARDGLKVACFDSHYVAGGCATMFSRGGPERRYNFDVGLHYIGDCREGGKIPRMLERLGIQQDYIEMDPDGFDELIFPDLRFRIPASKEVYRERLVAMFPKETRGIDRYIRFLNEVEYMSTLMEGTKRRSKLSMGWQVAAKGRLVARYSSATIGEFLDSCTRNIQLRAIMLGQNGDYGIAPSRCSALLHAGLVNHYFKGAFYPEGGGQIIADRVSEVIEKHGGSIHLSHGVEEILVEGSRVMGVRLEDGKGDVHAPVVISNADLKRTYSDLLPPEAVSLEQRDKVEGYSMGGAIFMTYLGVKCDLKDYGMGNTNYWQFDGYDFDAFYERNTNGGEPAVFAAYITSASLKEPDWPWHAPAGEQNLEVMTVVAGDPASWGVVPDQIDRWSYKKTDKYQALKQRVEDELVERLERVFPGTTEHITHRESATPVTHTRYTRASGGSGYGLAATPGQFMRGRPGYRGELEGLYFAGASTRSGHGIVGAMLSGEEAAKRIRRDRG